MIDTFLIMDQTEKTFEKTGSIGEVFIPLEIYKLNSTFETRNRSLFPVISTFVFGECYLHKFQQMNFN